MQDDAADELHVEVPHVQRAFARLAYHRERFREQVVERFALGETVAELDGLAAQLLVRELLDLWFFGADLDNQRSESFQLAIVGCANDLRQEGVNYHAEAGTFLTPRQVLRQARKRSGYQLIVRDRASAGQ